MAEGPGKYDTLTTFVREQTQAAGVVLIVFDGNQGNGFSVQATTSDVALQLPQVLRKIADDIDENIPRA